MIVGIHSSFRIVTSVLLEKMMDSFSPTYPTSFIITTRSYSHTVPLSFGFFAHEVKGMAMRNAMNAKNRFFLFIVEFFKGLQFSTTKITD